MFSLLFKHYGTSIWYIYLYMIWSTLPWCLYYWIMLIWIYSIMTTKSLRICIQYNIMILCKFCTNFKMFIWLGYILYITYVGWKLNTNNNDPLSNTIIFISLCFSVTHYSPLGNHGCSDSKWIISLSNYNNLEYLNNLSSAKSHLRLAWW